LAFLLENRTSALTTKALRLLVFVGFAGAPLSTYAQGVDTIVEIPTEKSRHALVEIEINPWQTAVASGQPLVVASDYKSAKNVVEPEKEACWNWYVEAAYLTEYNFRGTNLTPDADGALFFTADVRRWGFTLGLVTIHQLGTARAGSRSVGEGGGAGAQSGTLGLALPETIQDRFNELDVVFQYQHDFGPIEITGGNIAFFIDRRAETFVAYPDFAAAIGANGDVWGPFRTVENETFDRLFVRLATHKIPYVEPWITYYQNIYSQGQDPVHHEAFNVTDPSVRPIVWGGPMTEHHIRLRNPDPYGGYLEGRIRGNVPISEWLDLNPFGVISYSFGDRMVPVGPPAFGIDYYRGKPLRDWNVAQFGLETPIHLLHFVGYSSGPCAAPDVHLDLVPTFTYSHHISRPTPGTDRDEVFGGVKVAVTF